MPLKHDLSQEYLQSIEPVLKEREKMREIFLKYLQAFVDSEEIDPKKILLDEECEYELVQIGCIESTFTTKGFVWGALKRKWPFSEQFSVQPLPSLTSDLSLLARYEKQWEEDGYNDVIPVVSIPEESAIIVGTYAEYKDVEANGIPISLLKAKIECVKEPLRDPND